MLTVNLSEDWNMRAGQTGVLFGETALGEIGIKFSDIDTIVVLSAPVSNSRMKGLEPDDYFGEIVFRDGRTVSYTNLGTSGYGMETIPFSKEFSYHEYAGSLDKFDVRKVSRIDFLSEVSGFDLGGKEVPDYAKVNNWIYKVNITFRDGTKWTDIYIYGGAWRWKNDYAEGVVVNAKSITINVRQ